MSILFYSGVLKNVFRYNDQESKGLQLGTQECTVCFYIDELAGGQYATWYIIVPLIVHCLKFRSLNDDIFIS